LLTRKLSHFARTATHRSKRIDAGPDSLQNMAVMQRFLPILLLALAGCVVQSLHPFYTPTSVTKPTELAGDWYPIESTADTNRPVRAWPLTASDAKQFEWVTYVENSPGKLKVTFFHVGTNLFADFLAGDFDGAEKCLNGYWLIHVYPVHSVARVETNNHQLTIIPLNEDWLRKAIHSNTVSLAHLQPEGAEDLLYTATPGNWMKFLGRYGTDTNAFPIQDAYKFRRRP
jgi:hypothetical protein